MKRHHLRYRNQTRSERTWTIHLISLTKMLKGVLLLVVGFRVLTLLGTDVHAMAMDFVTRHGIDAANRYVEAALERLAGVGNTQLIQFSTIAFIYAALVLTEGIGLWFQKRWAEYMTAYLTAAFIPFELYELYERFTWVRIAILVLNIFVVWYLATRLRDERKEEITIDKGAGSVLKGWKSPEYPDVKVKICGITNLQDAKQALEAGADELGFNFYKKSSRYISPEDSRDIIDNLPIAFGNIGVFVNEDIEKVLEIAEFVGLDGIQLHGDEDNAYVKELQMRTKLFVIKTFSVNSVFSVTDAMDWDMSYPLFDTYSPNKRGGTGKPFDWENFGADIFLLFPWTAYLAGGLTSENVAGAVRIVHPYAVDVASGVESSPGKKDPEKVTAFIKAAKEAI
ncbi:MAG: DUF2127 domain-containing protein [Pyrinomonadaceae bacterium]